MDIDVIASLISSIGFPIVCCGALFWKMNKQDELHREETEKLSEALQNNTIAINALIDKLGE